MRRFYDIIQRAVAVFFTLSAIAIGIYGICILRFDLLGTAAVWYIIGVLTVQSIKDIRQALEDRDYK